MNTVFPQIALIIALTTWPILFLLMWRINHFPKRIEKHRGERLDVSVIIPVRNEDGRIRPLLESLQRQTRSAKQVLFIDDHSTDETAEVIADAGFEVVSLKEAGPDYRGKAMACWYGASLAGSELLIFLDADVILARDGLERMRSITAGRDQLISFQPYHRTFKGYESFSSFFTLVTLASLDCFTPRSGAKDASGSFGPCMICRRDTYLRVGGHQAVRDEIIDDMSLNRLFRRNDIPTKSYMGNGIAEYRMYPEGIPSLIEGWTKNIAPGAEFIRKSALFSIFLWITGCFASVILFFLPIDWFIPIKLPAIICYSLYASQMFFYYRKLGNSSVWAALLYPVQSLFFLLIFIRSFFSFKIRKRVIWKNRVLKVP